MGRALNRSQCLWITFFILTLSLAFQTQDCFAVKGKNKKSNSSGWSVFGSATAHMTASHWHILPSEPYAPDSEEESDSDISAPEVKLDSKFIRLRDRMLSDANRLKKLPLEVSRWKSSKASKAYATIGLARLAISEYYLKKGAKDFSGKSFLYKVYLGEIELETPSGKKKIEQEQIELFNKIFGKSKILKRLDQEMQTVAMSEDQASPNESSCWSGLFGGCASDSSQKFLNEQAKRWAKNPTRAFQQSPLLGMHEFLNLVGNYSGNCSTLRQILEKEWITKVVSLKSYTSEQNEESLKTIRCRGPIDSDSIRSLITSY